jgi:hypothetical protein
MTVSMCLLCPKLSRWVRPVPPVPHISPDIRPHLRIIHRLRLDYEIYKLVARSNNINSTVLWLWLVLHFRSAQSAQFALIQGQTTLRPILVTFATLISDMAACGRAVQQGTRAVTNPEPNGPPPPSLM